MIQRPSHALRPRGTASNRRAGLVAIVGFVLTGLAASIAIAPASASAATLTRYPYINKLTPTSVLIAWQTDVATTSSVLYSEDLSYSLTASDPAVTVDHVVTITSLAEETLYFYKVVAGTDTLTLGDDYFITAPSGPAPVFFAAFGDLGRATPEQIALASRIEAMAPDLAILTGDIIYESGEAANFTPQYFDIYQPTIARIPFYTAMGNHDLLTSNGQPYLDAFYLPTNSTTGTERYYSFDHGDAHFVCLEVTVEGAAPDAAMLAWLDLDLAASPKKWKFVFFHVPAYSNGGGHGGDATIAAALGPILESRGVDVVFQGHNHFYTRTYPIVGGAPTNVASNPFFTNPSGPVWITTGGGGRSLHTLVAPTSIEAHSYSGHHVVEGFIFGDTLSLAAVTPADSILDVMFIAKTATTAIALADFQAVGVADGVRLRWERTDGGSEGGFHVDRGLNAAGPWTRLTPELLRGSSSFEFVDRGAESGVTYTYRLAIMDGEGRETVTSAISAVRGAPLRFALERPRPNPARGTAMIPFTLDRAATTRVRIVDVSGRVVRTIASRALPAGAHAASWDGRDDRGHQAASGIYFAVVRAGDRELRTRVAFLR